METAFAEWADRLRASDESACTELFGVLHRPLLHYAARLLRDEDDAYDVVQDAFIRLWDHREQLDPGRSLKAYLYTIVRNLAFNRMKQQSRQEQRFEALDPAVLSSEAHDTMTSGELKEAGGTVD